MTGAALIARSRLVRPLSSAASMPRCARTIAIVTGMLVLAASSAQAGTTTDELDTIGGRRKPMTENSSRPAFQSKQERVAVAQAEDRETTAAQKLRALLVEIVAANAYNGLPPTQRLAKLDEFLKRLQALGPHVAGTRVAATYQTSLNDLREERANAALKAGRDPSVSASATDGPYTDFEWLGQRGIMALINPLQREDFRASLARGIDFNVGVSAIERSVSGWLVQLSGRLGVAGTPGQGFFCRVDGNDTSSLEVLRGITPPYGIVHVAAPGLDEFLLQSEPLLARIVFSPCRVSAPDNGPRRGAPGGQANAQTPPDARVSGRSSSATPVAPSPTDLRCTTRPSRFAPEYAMARRLRQAWAIPEPLRADPSLLLTFAVTLNFDAQLQAAPRLLRSESRRATPEQLNAAADAADRAIRETAPFPELGQSAGGTMQIDMTPCD